MKRGKQPKEREKYILRMKDGELIEVTREVYLEWYQSRRREKYQRERDQKYGICSLDALEENGTFSSGSVHDRDGLEKLVLQNFCQKKLMDALKRLSRQDAYLIYLLYYEDRTIKEAAKLYQCSHASVRYRKNRILDKLRRMMQEEETEE